MAKHLTDAKKKKIIADYVGCGNYSEVARKNKVSKDTVRRLCNRKRKKSKIPKTCLNT